MFAGFMLILIVFTLFLVAFGCLGYLILKIWILYNENDDYFIQQRNDERIYKSLTLVIPTFLFLFIFIWLLILGESQRLPIMFGYITVGFATIGWIFTNYISSKNSIRQHTLTILTQMRMSTEFMKNANKLQAELDRGVCITFENYSNISSKNLDIKESIRYILNYLEFVSAGIRLGDLDESLVKETQRGMFLYTYETCENYIIERNKINKTTYQHFIATIKKWKREN